MIVSHKHRFIFIKAVKVAGTSIEINLARHCGKDDVITPIKPYSKDSDEHVYVHPAQNYRAKDFENHLRPEQIRKRVGDKVWNEYFKFTVVRNPWDQIVSKYWWEKNAEEKVISHMFERRKILSNLLNAEAYCRAWEVLSSLIKKKFWKIKKRSPFEVFVRGLDRRSTNEDFCFDSEGNRICDYYIRFEDLDSGYKEVCRRLGITYEPVPRTKNKQRKKKMHYSAYYNRRTKNLVARLAKHQIKEFDYRFEQK